MTRVQTLLKTVAASLARLREARARAKHRRAWMKMAPAHREILSRVLLLPDKTWTDEYRRADAVFALLTRRIRETRNHDVIRMYALWQTLSGHDPCETDNP